MFTLDNILLIILGMILHRIISSVLVYGKAFTLTKSVEHACLKMLGGIAADIEFIKIMKQKTVECAVDNCSDLKIQNNLDLHDIRVWKRLVINGMLSDYPEKFKSSIKFNDWDSAMVRLSELDTKQINKK